MSVFNSPYFRQPASVRSVMLRVLAALLPGIAAYVWFFGAAILVQIVIASLAALAGEAAMLAIRKKPLGQYLGDGSALVTGWLIALTFPPIAPWWLVTVATLLAIVVVKHLYGGLGQNPFNPAMAAFCLMIVAFPQLMSQWPPANHGADVAAQMQLIFGGVRDHLDALTTATPLDALRTGLHSAGTTVAGVMASQPTFGMFGGKGWEWVALAYLVGGLWMWQQRIITWHIPAAFLASLMLIAGIAHVANPDRFVTPLFHLLSSGAMLGAFFIATDPITAATTPRGKLIYGAGIGLLVWVIRVFGAYPDGVAFATLLLNICTPLIDLYTQPPVFGHKEDGGKGATQ
jgi:electron transport complex protein RnfD